MPLSLAGQWGIGGFLRGGVGGPQAVSPRRAAGRRAGRAGAGRKGRDPRAVSAGAPSVSWNRTLLGWQDGSSPLGCFKKPDVTRLAGMDARPIGCVSDTRRYQVGRDRWPLGVPDITRLAGMRLQVSLPQIQKGRFLFPNVVVEEPKPAKLLAELSIQGKVRS